MASSAVKRRSLDCAALRAVERDVQARAFAAQQKRFVPGREFSHLHPPYSSPRAKPRGLFSASADKRGPSTPLRSGRDDRLNITCSPGAEACP